MPNIYIINKIKNKEVLFLENQISSIDINQNNWSSDYCPRSTAKLGYDDNGIHVFMNSFEKNILATFYNRNEAVYTDSCLEFFFMPIILDDSGKNQNDKYINFEINPLGTMLTQVGKSREDRIFFDDGNKEYFKVQTSLEENYWSVYYYIPKNLIAKYILGFEIRPNAKLMGNFYKCGENTKIPHHLSWNKIQTTNPDFHQPKSFAEIIFA